MQEPIDIVKSFFKRWGPKADDLHAAMRNYLSADACWENVGLVSATGPEEAVTILKQFGKRANFVAFDVQLLHIAAAGNVVMSERVDHALRADGSRAADGIRVMGIFEIQAGKIAKWRDYFDTAPFVQPKKSDTR